MAIYHCSVKVISRSKGRSATAAAAYRAGSEIVDARTGECFDYGRKRGVLSATLIVPDGAPDWARDRAALWNAAEASETRKNATVAREFEVALPHELTAEQRQQLAHDFAREIQARHGCVADVAIHEPDKGRRRITQDGDERVEREGGDQRNHHAHILCSTRRLTPDGFGTKCRELDDLKTGEIGYWRQRWAELANEHLERAGHAARIDHRSLAAQGIDREPTQHLGPAATGYERRTGEPSWLRQMHEQEAAQARLEAAAKAAQEAAPADASIIDLETQLRAALDERDRRQGVVVNALEQWRGYLGQRPEAAQVIATAAQVRARVPGAIEQAEQLARSLNVAEKAAQARAEAERQAAEHRAKLDAEAAQKRAQEAAWLAGLAGTATPSPSPFGACGAAPESAEKLAPEPRVADAEQQRQDSFRALLERQQREAEQAKEEAPDYDRDWGMDGP